MYAIRSSLRASSSKVPMSCPLSRSTSSQVKRFVPNPNGANVQIVRQLMQVLESEGILTVENGSWKARRFEQAFQAIDACPTVINSGRDALSIAGVGEGIARRIDEFLHPQIINQNERVNKPQKSIFDLERDECIAEFRRVPGIGAMKAGKLFDAGCRTLGDLKHPNHSKLITAKDRKALEYVDHLGSRVKRKEIESVLSEMRRGLSSDVQLHAVGSFRRGIASSAEIAIIVFHPTFAHVPHPTENPLTSFPYSTRTRARSRKSFTSASQDLQKTTLRREIIGPLERAGLIADTLSESSENWKGMARVPGLTGAMPVYRRMNISLSEGAALIAKTGDKDFNAYIRSCAAKQGLLLNEYGLWKCCSSDRPFATFTSPSTEQQYPDSSKSDRSHWELIASETEADILEAIGVGFVEPEKRNFSFIVQRSRSEASAVLKAYIPVPSRRKNRDVVSRDGTNT